MSDGEERTLALLCDCCVIDLGDLVKGKSAGEVCSDCSPAARLAEPKKRVNGCL